jgi:hypothetical protein
VYNSFAILLDKLSEQHSFLLPQMPAKAGLRPFSTVLFLGLKKLKPNNHYHHLFQGIYGFSFTSSPRKKYQIWPDLVPTFSFELKFCSNIFLCTIHLQAILFITNTATNKQQQQQQQD